MTFPSSRIENPSGGSTHSRSHSAVAEARNTKALASQAGQAMPRQPKIWISMSSARSVLQSIYVTQPRKRNAGINWGLSIRFANIWNEPTRKRTRAAPR